MKGCLLERIEVKLLPLQQMLQPIIHPERLGNFHVQVRLESHRGYFLSLILFCNFFHVTNLACGLQS